MNAHIDGESSVALVSSEGALVDWNSGFEAELGVARDRLFPGADFIALVEAGLGETAVAVTRDGFGESRAYCYARAEHEVKVVESKTDRGSIFRVASPRRESLRLGSEGSSDEPQTARYGRERPAAVESTGAASHFTATVNHELRTPMQGVLGMASLLLGTKLNPTQRAYLGAIDSSGRILMRLINDIVAVSEIGDVGAGLQLAALDLVDLVEGVVGLLAPRASDRGISVQIRIEPTVPRMIRGDALRLRQILLNILNSAITLTVQPSIELRVSSSTAADPASQGLLRFEIEGGAGEESAAPQGSLAVSRGLVERMGGALGVISESSGSSTLWLELPLSPEGEGEGEGEGEIEEEGEAAREAETEAETEAGAGSLGLKGVRVLIVEDNEVNLAVVEAFVVSAGGVCDLATDGKAAVSACAKQTYDVVLMDIHMPGMDGLTASQIIRAVRDPAAPPLKIVAISADARHEVVVQAADVGMDGWIAKPFDRDELVEAISRAIRSGPV